MCLVGHFLCPSIPTTAPPLCPSFSSFAFSIPASSLSPLFSFLLLALPPPPILCSTSSMRPGIVQLKCRNCPLEFILKFVAREPFISSRCFAIYPRPPTLILRCDKYKRIPIIFDGILSFSVQNSTCKRVPFPKCLYIQEKTGENRGTFLDRKSVARIPSGESEWSTERGCTHSGRYLQPGEERPGEEIKPGARVRTYVCVRSPEFQNCKFFNSRGRGGGRGRGRDSGGSPGKYLRLTYTNIAGDEGCVFKNLHRYILIKVS